MPVYDRRQRLFITPQSWAGQLSSGGVGSTPRLLRITAVAARSPKWRFRVYYQIPQLIPIQLQTVDVFTAPDPWNGNAMAQWTLSVYRMTAENNRNLYVNYSAEKQRESADGQNLDREDVLGIRSSVDGLYHILPAAMVRLWQQGRVPTVQLPGLIAAVEPRLGRRDFFDPVANQPWRRYIAYGMIGLGALFAAGGVWSFVTSPRDGTFVEFGLWVWFGLAIFLCIVGSALLLFLTRLQQKLAAREAEIAAMLPGGAGVFPGRPL